MQNCFVLQLHTNAVLWVESFTSSTIENVFTVCKFFISIVSATSLMIKDFILTASNETIILEWNSPPFQPKVYMILVSCRYMCATTEYFITAFMKEPITTSFSTHVQPNSICDIKLTATYNPASIDSGDRKSSAHQKQVSLQISIVFIQYFLAFLAKSLCENCFVTHIILCELNFRIVSLSTHP